METFRISGCSIWSSDSAVPTPTGNKAAADAFYGLDRGAPASAEHRPEYDVVDRCPPSVGRGKLIPFQLLAGANLFTPDRSRSLH
jgi:hypothetical protein